MTAGDPTVPTAAGEIAGAPVGAAALPDASAPSALGSTGAGVACAAAEASAGSATSANGGRAIALTDEAVVDCSPTVIAAAGDTTRGLAAVAEGSVCGETPRPSGAEAAMGTKADSNVANAVPATGTGIALTVSDVVGRD